MLINILENFNEYKQKEKTNDERILLAHEYKLGKTSAKKLEHGRRNYT